MERFSTYPRNKGSGFRSSLTFLGESNRAGRLTWLTKFSSTVNHLAGELMISRNMSFIFLIPIFAQLISAYPAWPNVFYEYDLIAKTRHIASGGTGLLTTLGRGPSINDKGRVEFRAYMDSGDNRLFYGKDSAPVGIAVESSNRVIGGDVQINNKDEIVGRLRVSGSPPAYLIRVYDGINSFTNIARGGGVSFPDFDSVMHFQFLATTPK